MKTKYNKQNKQVLIEYFDAENKPVMSKSNGYAKAEYKYDGKGNRTEEYYYDAKGVCFRNDVMAYNNKNRQTSYIINDGNNKPTDKFTSFSKVVVTYDNTGVVPSVRKYFTASGKLLATQKYDVKKKDWLGTQIITDWRDNVIKANKECPVRMDDGLLLYRVSYSGNTVTITMKLTNFSVSEIDEEKRTAMGLVATNLKAPMQQALKLPKSVGII